MILIDDALVVPADVEDLAECAYSPYVLYTRKDIYYEHPL
jgi:hypothetical protein